MLDTLIGDYLFLETLGQLLLFGLIITLAGVVRGCIGFGFSAIVVASTSFWLPPVAVVNLVVLLEIAASINMLPTVYKEVKRDLLIPLTVGSLLTTSLGTWFLATLSADVLQWVIGLYMLIVALLTLSGFQFKRAATPLSLFVLGLVAGFFNGMAAVGGIGAAWGMVGFKLSVKDIRAVLAVFFLFAEAVFLLTAWLSGLISAEILTTSALATFPLIAGIQIGSRLFTRFPEATLKRLVLIALILLSLFGIYKTIF